MTFKQCLNPCSNGICSARQIIKRTTMTQITVLILVLMEYALRVIETLTVEQFKRAS